MGGGGGTKTQYQQSPEQRAVFKAGIPVIEQLAQTATRGQSLWGDAVPQPVLPTQDYFESVAPQIQQALQKPYQDIALQNLEMLGAQGLMGGASTGPSGAAAAFMGRFAADAAPRIAQQAWQMGAPELMRFGQQQLESVQAPYRILPSMMGGVSPSFSTGITSPSGGFSPGGALMGAGMGGLGGALIAPSLVAAGAAPPLWPVAAGAGLFGLGGGFGGGK